MWGNLPVSLNSAMRVIARESKQKARPESYF